MNKHEPKEKYLLLAGGRIQCFRCQAKSKRTGLQCSAPAMAGKVMCKAHGGLSTGPRTEAGKRKIAAAQLKHGLYSKSAIAYRQQVAAHISELEDAMHVLGMTNAQRTPGRKSIRYEPVLSLEDLPRMIACRFSLTDDDSQK